MADDPSELYSLAIEHVKLDARARLFRECEAMVVYMGSRGYMVSDAIKDNVGILDVGINDRGNIAMADLLTLHGLLSEAIKPAIPRTIELLQWNAAKKGPWEFLAPVGALRWLLVLTGIFYLLFCFTLLTPYVDYETIAAGIFAADSDEFSGQELAARGAAADAAIARARTAAEAAAKAGAEVLETTAAVGQAEMRFRAAPEGERPTRQTELEQAQKQKAEAIKAANIANATNAVAAEDAIAATETLEGGRWRYSPLQTGLVTLFFISLAGLGACFSVLYDARKYVVEGTYDPRIGSNYTIRIALGVLSGVLLAQILSDPKLGENTSGLRVFGLPVLALLGGFASQLVYNILSKIVTAAESIFDQDRESALKAREQAVQGMALVQAERDSANRAVAAMEIARQFDATGSPDEQRAIVTQLVRTAAGLPTATGAGAAASASSQTALDRAAAAISLGHRLLDLLPPETTASAAATLERMAGRLAQARALPRSGGTANATFAAALATELDRANPLRTALGASLARLAPPLAPLAVPPSSLATTIVAITIEQDDAAYARWKVRLLDASYAPGLLPASDLAPGAVAEALQLAPEFGAAFGDITADTRAMADLGRQIADSTDDELFERHGARFGGDRWRFDAAVQAARRALLDPVVIGELPPHALKTWGADAAPLLAAIDAVRNDPAGRVELERLFLMAATLRDVEAAAERDALLDLLRRLAL